MSGPGNKRVHNAYVACGGCPSISIYEQWCALDAEHIGEHTASDGTRWFMDQEDLDGFRTRGERNDSQ